MTGSSRRRGGNSIVQLGCPKADLQKSESASLARLRNEDGNCLLTLLYVEDNIVLSELMEGYLYYLN